MSSLSELLVKLGYSRYALDSDVITEEMLDQMLTCPGSPAGHWKSDQKGGSVHPICADGKPFDAKPSMVASCI